jgi:hypothetical protein
MPSRKQNRSQRRPARPEGKAGVEEFYKKIEPETRAAA